VKRFFILAIIAFSLAHPVLAAADDTFAQGSRDYAAGHYEQAAANFNQAVATSPSVGALQNLGNAQWQCGETGLAILAWERAQWLDPLNPHSRENLRFARKTRLLEAPDLSWPEICSTWLPVNAWPWIAALSFWLAVSLVMLPGIFRWRKAGWHQALAAAGFAIFLLTIPAMIGVRTRAKIGVVLNRDTPLRLTPTAEAQSVARLAAGETARVQRERERYLYIRTATTSGWIDRTQFALIAREQ
jgi:tetratricopeptide (TPR) repeat protein